MTRTMHSTAKAMAHMDSGQSNGVGNTGQKFRWEVLDNGNDARFLFGKHKDSTVGALVQTDVGKEYLSWVYRVGPEKLRSIIEGFFEQ